MLHKMNTRAFFNQAIITPISPNKGTRSLVLKYFFFKFLKDNRKRFVKHHSSYLALTTKIGIFEIYIPPPLILVQENEDTTLVFIIVCFDINVGIIRVWLSIYVFVNKYLLLWIGFWIIKLIIDEHSAIFLQSFLSDDHLFS